ncbi:MAG: M20 peptidase family dipeptidase, partial [Betaproteobacteria bacterium]|nr:M20 peptidase family dipeptidase [Betaproteobacteria bacterium]
MTRDAALAAARAHFDSGAFLADLARRVACRTESQDPASGPALTSYLADEIGPSLATLGFTFAIHPNPDAHFFGPFLVGQRHEGDGLPTVLVYGHGDVIRGQDKSWTRGAGPWQVKVDGERIYGR